ncbi:hypothetical protein HYPSUDRAFT_208846 [Hypholoma sublateritium FD-334 SS-4]|uniref:Uncharacterized protein n=1 Tax=Hypholoma sublateritium (strain FD-334 SS-4) TaxID=945553 RepID=A0A0D2NCJ5_HYPSF|nr:hypothetical protein HYPSUDRAFT_208846 [Hypholoma sublateritium FD-334 SS-4]
MPASRTHSPQPNARSVTLPSFAEFVASCSPERPQHHATLRFPVHPLAAPSSHAAPASVQRELVNYQRPSAVTDPTVKDMAAEHFTTTPLPQLPGNPICAPPSHAAPAPVQRMLTKYHRPSAPTGSTTEDSAKVRVHFCGPVVIYRLPHPIPRALLNEPQIHGAINAHSRRMKTYGHDPALRPPTAEGAEIDLCHVDFIFSMRSTGAWFHKSLKGLMPPDVDGIRHYVLRWDIVCARCGEAVTHLEADKVWNGRFLEHQRECEARCALGKEIRPPAVGQAAMVGHGDCRGSQSGSGRA